MAGRIIVGTNSFVTVADADTFIDFDMSHALWDELNTDEKERVLLNVYQKMLLVKDFVPPTDLTDSCLPEAQSKQAIHMLKYELFDEKGSQQIRIEEMGPITTEYFKNENIDRLDVNEWPEEVMRCLESYGAVRPSSIGGFGSLRRTR